MATTVAAMKARLGDTDYFILTMKAKELADKITIPKDLEGWSDWSVEELYQRDINYHRVRTQIAPYLANDESRFFGAVIVTALNFGDDVSFEPLADVATKGLPGLYRSAAASMGFLTFTGGEVLVPLDGQHRLKAIQFAVSGRDQKGQEIPNLRPTSELAREDITVILVAFEKEKARKIFTKVNRYAKATTTGQNIVTEDDDIVAVLAREVANKCMGGRLAKFTSNTLRPKDRHFTTLAIVYNCNWDIISRVFEEKPEKAELPVPAKQQLWRAKVFEVWNAVLDGIDVFADAVADKTEGGDDGRREIRRASLLGKPVVQECLVGAFVQLTGALTNMSAQEACERLNALPWNITEEDLKIWRYVLWSGGAKDGKVITKNRKLATSLMVQLAGGRLTEESRAKMEDEYRKLFPEEERAGVELPAVR